MFTRFSRGRWIRSAPPVGAFVFILICSFNLISRLYYSAVGTSGGSCASAGSRRGVDLFVVSGEHASYCSERGSGY
jgi:hypothetical protein